MFAIEDLFDAAPDLTEELLVQAVGAASVAVLGPLGPSLVNVLNKGRKTARAVERAQKMIETAQRIAQGEEVKPMGAGEHGIQQTKEVLFFIFSFSQAVNKSMADGEFNWYDAKNFIEPLQAMVDAFDDIGSVVPEISDLSPEEMNELVAYVKENFDIEDDALEQRIEDAIDTGVEMIKLFTTLKFK